MSELNLSSAAKAILEAAKKDGPSAAARTKVWGSVSSAMSSAAAASGAISATAAATGSVGAAKMLALGTLLGGTLSVGVATTVLYVGHSHKAADVVLGVKAAAAADKVAREKGMGATEAAASTPTPTSTATPTPTKHALATSTPKAPHIAPVDGLAREASLVADARSALASGDPRSALQAIHDARALSSRQMAPEELAVEAHALRALGRQDEANEADSTLKAQFPESALVR
jgi:hypothetical protein